MDVSANVSHILLACLANYCWIVLYSPTIWRQIFDAVGVQANRVTHKATARSLVSLLQVFAANVSHILSVHLAN